MGTTRLRLAAASLLLAIPAPAAFPQSAKPGPGTGGPPAAVEPNAVPNAVTGDWRASQLIGTTMTNVLGETVGSVEDVVIDSDGKVVAVLVKVGGFLGLGESTVAIGLRHLVITRTDADQLEVKTSLSRKAIEQAANLDPEDDKPVAP